MRRYAVILHPNAELGKRLAAFWSQQKSLGLPVRAFSECSQYAHFRTGAAVEILLFSEHFAEEMQGLIGNSFALLLSEDGFVGEQALNTISVPTLFLYRPADALARSIMALYAKARGDALLSVSRGECEILGIYSPVHRCGKTTLSLSLGLARAARGNTLLLSLEEYAGVYGQIAPDGAESLSELLLAHCTGRYRWSELQSRLSSFGALKLLPPVRSAEDLSLLPPEEFASLIQRIADESAYRNVILDFGSFGRRALELLEICDRVFMPVLGDPLSALKLASFREYLQKSGREKLLEKVETLELPNEREKAQDYACALLPAYESGLIYELAAALH